MSVLSRLAAVLAALTVFSVSGPALAAKDLEAALVALEVAAERDPNLSKEFKEALGQVTAALREREEGARSGTADGSEPGAVGAAAPAEKSFWDRIHPYANVGLRFEWDHNRAGQGGDRIRGRTRLKLGASYDVTDELEATFRLRTGNPDDPGTPWVDFGELFDSFAFNLDLLYLGYSPTWLEGSWLKGGKVEYSFETNPVYGELVWDADVHPEGGALGYRWGEGDGLELGFTSGGYVVAENADFDETHLFMVQGDVRGELAGDLVGRLAIGYHHYGDLTPGPDQRVIGDNEGRNLIVDANGDLVVGPGQPEPFSFVSDFEIFNPVASVTYSGFPTSLTLAGEYIRNFGSPVESADEGWAVGLAGRGNAFERDWRVFYQYQHVENEAVFAAFAQDDFLLANNFDGHVAGLEYWLTSGIKVRAWTLLAHPIVTPPGFSDRMQTRVRLDFDTYF